jgi:hypothetical protein
MLLNALKIENGRVIVKIPRGHFLRNVIRRTRRPEVALLGRIR